MKRFLLWIPSIIWMTFIFVLSGRQRVSVSEDFFVNFFVFKTLHVLEYAVLYVLNVRALGAGEKKRRIIALAWAFPLTLAFAASDEIHQTLVPTREGRFRDVIIDTTGTILAWYTVSNILPKAPKKLKDWAKRWQIL